MLEAGRDVEVRTRVLSLRQTELEERLRTRARALEDTRPQMLVLTTSGQPDQATIRARDTRIAAPELAVSRYREQFKTLTARVAAPIRQVGERKKRPAAPKLSKGKPGRHAARRVSKTIRRTERARR